MGLADTSVCMLIGETYTHTKQMIFGSGGVRNLIMEKGVVNIFLLNHKHDA